MPRRGDDDSSPHPRSSRTSSTPGPGLSVRHIVTRDIVSEINAEGEKLRGLGMGPLHCAARPIREWPFPPANEQPGNRGTAAAGQVDGRKENGEDGRQQSSRG